MFLFRVQEVVVVASREERVEQGGGEERADRIVIRTGRESS